jgi:hypothetical protein
MHFDWSVFIGWIVGVGTKVPGVVNFTQQTLTTTKTGMEVFEAGKKLIEKDAAEHPEQTVDRVDAMANMAKSMAPLAFAEVLFYAIKPAHSWSCSNGCSTS